MLSLTLLGTGNAAGMPLYGCACSVCESVRETSEGHRTPCSALIKVSGKQFLIDAGQLHLDKMFPAGSLHGIFLTHFHPDHVQGLFHLRWGVNQSIPVYAPPDSEGCSDLYKHSGILDFQAQKKYQTFEVEGMSITPLPLIHSKPTFGYLFAIGEIRIAYLTDTKGLPPGTLEVLSSKKLDALIMDCSFKPGIDGKGHNNLDEFIDIADSLNVNRKILTHIGHDFDVWLREHGNDLPEDIRIGYDGMELIF